MPWFFTAPDRIRGMDGLREAFLAGERPDHVCIYLSEAELDGGNAARLADVGEAVDGGVVLVLPGEEGRSAFSAAVGVDPMEFAGAAMRTDGRVATDLTDGDCPDGGDGDEHAPRFTFAFVEERNEEAGGLYAEGAVVHAYAACTCGETYSQRWLAGERAVDA